MYVPNPARMYVDVLAWHTPEGKTTPIRIRLEDCLTIKIAKVLDVRQAASLKAGGEGMRHICRIDVPVGEDEVRSAELHLFQTGNNWFIDGDDARELMNTTAYHMGQ